MITVGVGGITSRPCSRMLQLIICLKVKRQAFDNEKEFVAKFRTTEKMIATPFSIDFISKVMSSNDAQMTQLMKFTAFEEIEVSPRFICSFPVLLHFYSLRNITFTAKRVGRRSWLSLMSLPIENVGRIFGKTTVQRTP